MTRSDRPVADPLPDLLAAGMWAHREPIGLDLPGNTGRERALVDDQ